MNQFHQLLTQGLLKGFAGQTQFQNIKRAGFDFKSSHLAENGQLYHDEWLGERSGGGQEVVQIGNQAFTRVYAGGTLSENALAGLGITKAQISEFLISALQKYGDQTRLLTACRASQQGDWTYEYLILDAQPEIPVTTGKEIISYKNTAVFVHVFVLSPVE